MVRSGLFVSALAGAAGFLSQAEAKPLPRTRVVPGSYIVELQDIIDSSDFLKSIESLVENVLHIDHEFFRGVSIQFKDLHRINEHVGKLSSLSGVKQIWPNKVYRLPDENVAWTGRVGGPDYIQKVKRQTGNDTFTPHLMTQVNKLREKGFTGKGVRIGVIDSGIDYTHPALGGSFGPGNLVSYGTDLVGDKYDGENTPVPDDDPYTGCDGHGTHVAGIIAAQENEYGFTGAAPDVTLGAYRVFGCDGSAADDVLIEAFLQAYEDGSDIITASIGGSSGWTEDPWAVVVSRIVEAGVPCTISTGNEGEFGMFFASTASNGKKVTSVASFDNIVTPILLTESHFTVDGGYRSTFGYTPGEQTAWANVSLPVWSPSLDIEDTAAGCEPYPQGTPDLSKYIVLVRDGGCPWAQKAQNAAEFGARYVMFYNSLKDGTTEVSTEGAPEVVATGMVTSEQGEAWISQLKDGSRLVLSFLDPLDAPVFVYEQKNDMSGGFPSDYSTWNPTFEMDVKPQFAAPGGMILSTWPVALGSYSVISGTSMSCPLVAAIYALIGTARESFDPFTIESILSATALPQLLNDGNTTYPMLAPVSQQGAGLVQAFEAAYATTILSRSNIAFNDTDYLDDTTNFTITNLGKEDVTYELGSVGAATAYTFSDSIYPDYFPGLELTDEYATIELSDSKVTVPAGGESVVTVTVTPPEGLNATRIPVYSGYITLNGTNGDNLSLPYNGAVGSLNSVRVLDEAYLTSASVPDGMPIGAGNATFVLPAPGTATAEDILPVVVNLMSFGSPRINIKLASVGRGNRTDEVLGHIFGSPLLYAARGGEETSWDGTMDDESVAPAGTYKFIVEALHVYGNASDPSQFDVSETIPFSITYKERKKVENLIDIIVG